MTEGVCIGGPSTESACNHIRDNLADILLLRQIVAGSGMITRGCQRPAAFPGSEFLEKTRGVTDVLVRVEHRLERSELT